MKNLLPCLLFLLICACKNDTNNDLLQNEIQVVLLDFNSSCNEDLLLIQPTTIWDEFNKTDNKFLYADIANHPDFNELTLGDTLSIEYELFPEANYPQRLILCNRFGGLLVKIIKIK